MFTRIMVVTRYQRSMPMTWSSFDNMDMMFIPILIMIVIRDEEGEIAQLG